MRPQHLRLTNFGSVAEADIDMSVLSLVAIVGENGSGKSTILKAMNVALWGSKADSLDSLVRQGTTGFMVDFEFTVADKPYRVVREQGKQQKAILYSWTQIEGEQWNAIAGPKVSDVDAAIVTLLGCTYTEFSIAHHLPQGGLGAFADLDASERKAWLMRNLPMGEWESLERAAKDRLTAVKTSVVAKRGGLDALLATDTDTTALKADLAHMEDGLTMKRTALAKTEQFIAVARDTNDRWNVAEHDVIKARAAETAASVAVAGEQEAERSAQSSLTAIDTVLTEVLPTQVDTEALVVDKATLEEQARGIEKMEQEAIRAANAEDDAEQDVTNATAAFDKALRAYDAHREAEEAICPTCQQVVGGAAREAVTEALRDGVVRAENDVALAAVANEEAQERYRTAKAEVEAVSANQVAARLSALERDIADARNIDAQYARHEQARSMRSEVAEKVDVAANNVADAKAAYEDSRKTREHCEAIRDNIERIDVASAEESRRTLNAEVGETLATVARIEGTIARAEKVAVDIDVARKVIAVHESEQTTLELLVKAYSKNGIPARIIEGALAEIETHANAFLSRFTNGLSVTFQTQRENKSGGTLKETLDILVTDSTGTRDIKRFSGGERTRVHFALAVGIGQFLAAHGGGRIESFSVDEPDALDTAGVNELIKCLHMLSHSVPCVLLVSHIESLSEAMPQRITVRKGANGSKMEVSV